ncbi:MAG: AI-2E family transporter [Miltoncostaeaceae bacterium]
MSAHTGIVRAGRLSWSLLGIAGVIALVIVLIAVTRSVTVPLILAGFVAVVFAPLVDRLAAHMSRAAAAGLVLALVLALSFGVLALVVAGIADEGPAIADGIRGGVAELQDGLEGLIGANRLEELRQSAGSFEDEARDGAAAWLASKLDSLAAYVAGSVLALIILLYLMISFPTVKGWLVKVLSDRNPAETEGIVDESISTVQRYFLAQATVALIDGVLIGLAAWLLGVPLAVTIAVVTFTFAFIPYLGAFVSGTLAVLLALSTGEPWRAVAILAVVLVVNNVVDNLVSPQIQGEAVGLHPLVILLAVAIGGVVAGIIGAILAVPTTAIVVKAVGHVRERGGVADTEGAPAPPNDLTADGAEP